MSASEIRAQLYDNSQFEAALQAAHEALRVCSDDAERAALCALKAWCYYRQSDYDLASQAAHEAGENRWAQECLLHLYAYAPPFKNDQLLQELACKLGESVNVSNAIVIRARDDDSTITHDEVLRHVLAHLAPEVATANLYHNAARFFLAKSRDQKDRIMALGLLEVAITRYGSGNQNVHHRAAAHFWKSKIVEQLFGKEAAQVSAQQAVELWHQQVRLDPQNRGHRQRWEGALRYLADLIKKE